MEKNLREIETIMEQFYAKQEENEKLFNANKEDEADLKAKLLNLKQKRTDERNQLKGQLSTLESRKKLIIEQKIQENIPVINNFRDGYKSVLYQQREEELISEISEMNKKEEEVRRLKLEIKRLESNIDSLMSPYILGIDEYDSIMKNSFNGQYEEVKNNLISRIDALTSEVEQKDQLEKELYDLRMNRDRELSRLSILNTPTNTFSYDSELNFKAKGVKNKKFQAAMKSANEEDEQFSTEGINGSFILKSLEQSYNVIENKFTLRIKALLKESDEEKSLKKQIKEIAKRPNYNRVYLKEMLELKMDLNKKLEAQRKIVEPIIKAEISKISQSILLEQQEIKDRDRKLMEKEEQAILYRENKLGQFKNEFDEFGNIINQGDYEKLLQEYNTILAEKSYLEAQNNDGKVEVIDNLCKQKADLESILVDIKAAVNLIKPTEEEVNILVNQLEPYEQEEYDRRSRAKIAEEEAKKSQARLELEKFMRKLHEEKPIFDVQTVVEKPIEETATEEVMEESIEETATEEVTDEIIEETATEEVMDEIIEETATEDMVEGTLKLMKEMESEEETTYEKLLSNSVDDDLDSESEDLVNIDVNSLLAKFAPKKENEFVSIEYDPDSDVTVYDIPGKKSSNNGVDMVVPMEKIGKKPKFSEKFKNAINDIFAEVGGYNDDMFAEEFENLGLDSAANSVVKHK